MEDVFILSTVFCYTKCNNIENLVDKNLWWAYFEKYMAELSLRQVLLLTPKTTKLWHVNNFKSSLNLKLRVHYLYSKEHSNLTCVSNLGLLKEILYTLCFIILSMVSTFKKTMAKFQTVLNFNQKTWDYFYLLFYLIRRCIKHVNILQQIKMFIKFIYIFKYSLLALSLR